MNPDMQKLLRSGDGIDVSGFEEVEPGVYVVPEKDFDSDGDYFDLKLDRWIWSIVREKATGRILASLDARFADARFEPMSAQYELLWLR